MNGTKETLPNFFDLEDEKFWDQQLTAREIREEEQRVRDKMEAEDNPMKEMMGGASASQADVPRHECPKCHGHGHIKFYVRGGGYGQTPQQKECWKCHGVGYFKTSPEKRQQNVERRQARKDATAIDNRKDAEIFLESRPELKAWLERGVSSYNTCTRGFTCSLRDALYKYGSWTEKQLAAVERSIARNQDYDAKRSAEEAQLPQSGLNLSHIPSGYYSPPEGDTRLKLKIDNITDTDSKWHDWVFVKDGAHYGGSKRYGSQKPGQDYRGDVMEALTVIAADPFEASKAYGKLVGRCGVCGRKLERQTSIDLGIGPVCVKKFGG